MTDGRSERAVPPVLPTTHSRSPRRPSRSVRSACSDACATRPAGAAVCAARGGRPARKRAGGHPPALSLAEQTLVIVLRLRFRPPQRVLAELLGVVTGTIAKAERQTRPLLEQYGYQIEPAGTPIKTLAGLTAYASVHGSWLTPKAKPAC